MVLNKLTEKDMDYSGDYDRIFTFLDLRDYDWMNYIFTALFPVKTDVPGKIKHLSVCFDFCGVQSCDMTVIVSDKCFYRDYEGYDLKNVRKTEKIITYRYSCELFEKHIKKFMEAHMNAWDGEYAFYGGELALDFYNDVLKNGIIDDKTSVEV